MRVAPAAGYCFEFLFVLGPIMQRGRIEVCPRFPDQGVNFGVDLNAGKDRRIPQRSIQLAFKHWLKIDDTRRVVVKTYTQNVWPDLLHRRNAANLMFHSNQF